jgi:Icc-related predicted phosphoesterase
VWWVLLKEVIILLFFYQYKYIFIMNITFISDTHTYMYDNNYKELILPEGDILCFTGDIMSSGYNEGELIHFLKWISKQPFKYKIFIAGNHDRLLEDKPLIANDIISQYTDKGVIYLKNTSIEIEGFTFYGTPHQPYFGGWAFNVPDYGKLISIYQLIPDNVDVFLTHCPPYGILDQSHRSNYHNPSGENHLGSMELKEVLDAKILNNTQPRVVAFGHIHGDGGKQIQIGDTLYINASLCDEYYEPVNNIVRIELT